MTHKRIAVAQPVLNGNERRYVLDCIDSSWISTLGDYVPKFERAFADSLGCRHAIACSNGTAALHLSLLALGVGPGDEVIVPTLTYVATANVAAYVGARPIFIDVDPDTWCLDPAGLEALIGPRTRAIIPVHLYGHPAAMSEILRIAAVHGIPVIEDAAQAQGAAVQGRMVGTLGTLAAFSFFGNKTLTCGQGGMVTTDDDGLAARIRHLAGVGMDPQRHYWHDVVGYNYRMTNIEAAIGLGQIERLEWHLARRQEVAARYRARLEDVPGVVFQAQHPNVIHGHWMVNVLLRGADAAAVARCRQHLEGVGIETRIGFPPVHAMPPFAGGASTSFPVAETVARESLTLPTHAGLTSADIDYVCDAFGSYLDSLAVQGAGSVS